MPLNLSNYQKHTNFLKPVNVVIAKVRIGGRFMSNLFTQSMSEITVCVTSFFAAFPPGVLFVVLKTDQQHLQTGQTGICCPY